MTSNSSPLLKDSQKTKGIIWKPLIAISSLSIFSFISGQYLPYVIVAVSGSGAIVAVPLAIFAVSTVVALISTIYLIRLAVSRADNKKEVGLNGQKFGHTPSQEPQKFVCENCTNLENKSSVPTPTPPPVTLGTQPSVSAPPPPPPEPTPKQLNQASVAVQKNSANTTGEKSPAGTTQKSTTTKKSTPPGGGKQQKTLIDELSEKLKSRRKGISGKQEDDVQQPNNLPGVFGEISNMILPPRSRSNSVSSNSSEESEQDWSDEKNECSKPQSFHKERSESPDSGNISGDDVHSKLTSPLPPEPKAEKPLISPKPVNLKTKSEAPPATTVTEVKNSSTRSVKGLTEMFNNLGGSPVFSS